MPGNEKVLYPTDISEHFDFEKGGQLRSVSAGKMHSGAVLESGECFTWGGNELGQLGLPGVKKSTHVPERVDEIEVAVDSVTCGYYQTLFLATDGSILACGLNEAGQLGVDDDSEIVDLPVPVKGIEERVVALYSTNFSSAVTEDNSLYIWGDTPNGLFTAPERINGLAGIIDQVAIGEDLICVLDVNNFVYTWGRNEVGQLGLGNTEAQKDACSVEFLNDRDIVSITAGKNFILCLGKGAASKSQNPLLDQGESDDGQATSQQRESQIEYKPALPNNRKSSESAEDNEQYQTDQDRMEYKLVNGDTFGEKNVTCDSEEIQINEPSARSQTKVPVKNHNVDTKQTSEQLTHQGSEKDLEGQVPDSYQLPKSILDLYKNQKQTEAIYAIKEVETMQKENVVLKQLVCTYEKIRQDLVSILDAVVRNDPSLIAQLDPRDIQKYQTFTQDHPEREFR